jgi:hypothetical protein
MRITKNSYFFEFCRCASYNKRAAAMALEAKSNQARLEKQEKLTKLANFYI